MRPRFLPSTPTILLPLFASLFAAPTVAGAAEALACQSQPASADGREFTCALEGAAARRPLRFKALFSGGHDDTVASMQVTLDGQPMACEDGSKTRLMGEDGEVSLECRFSVAQRGDSTHQLGVLLKWSHAQYTDAGLQAD